MRTTRKISDLSTMEVSALVNAFCDAEAFVAAARHEILSRATLGEELGQFLKFDWSAFRRQVTRTRHADEHVEV